MLKPNRLYIINFITSLLPASRLFNFKNKLYRWAGVDIADNVHMMSSVIILGDGELSIGENSFIGHYTKIIVAGGMISIGNNVDISSSVTIINGTHEISKEGLRRAGKGKNYNIFIEDGSWIGAGSLLITKTNIGQGTVIGAGATVCHNCDSNSIYIGSKLSKLKKIS